MATMTQESRGAGNRDAGTTRTRWWQRPWIVPLAFVTTVFLVFSLPPYLGLDPALSRVPAPPGVDWYYPLLVTHIGLGSIAMSACVFQIWPWFRTRFPAAHRRIGRVYVFGGALPAAITAVPVAAAAPFGPVGAASSLVLAPLWFGCTVAGFRAARARDWGAHRRWMIRSFVLTMSIITNRVWGVVCGLVYAPQLDTMFQGNETALVHAISGTTTWLGWVVPLLIAQWWLERGRGRRARNRATARAQAAR